MNIASAAHRTAVVGEQIIHQPWLRRLGGLGLSARAVIYAVLGYLAFDIAFSGSSPTQASGEGALAEVARHPGGPEALGLLAAGLVAYVLWRVSATFGYDDTGGVTIWKRLGWMVAAAVYLALFVQAVGLLVGIGSSSGPSNHPSPYVASVLRWPGGPAWVDLAGSVVIVVGIIFTVWGLIHDYGKDLTVGRLSQRGRLSARAMGAFGNLTRGLLIILIGIYLLDAGVTGDPAKVKSLDAVLLAVAHRPFGPWLLGVAASGLLAYAVFSLVEARHRRL
ncbi:MAG: DUF1206 domain-containing protein [Acidimicrobiales bacterium]